MRMTLPGLLVLGILGGSSSLRAQDELGRALKDIPTAPHWIYGDLPKALAQARESGKPLLIVLRCVPCLPGRTLDAKAMTPDADLEQLEKQFVCVRIIQTNGLDLKTFQYDYDQSWACMILTPDGTVLGRYGTRMDSRPPNSEKYLNVPSFRKALERALEVHRNYPANKDQLAGKNGKEPAFPRPEAIPGLQNKPKVAATRQECIHCHMVQENILRAKWQKGTLTNDDLWIYPMPDTIGLQMDPDDGLRVKGVTAGSPAAKAGLAAGDDLVSLNGQPLISLADIQWVLHTVPSQTELAVSLQRDGQKVDRKIALSGPWKEGDLAWRASSWFGLRQGLKVEPAPNSKQMALVIKGLYGTSAQVLPKAGVRNGDVIVAVDGKTEPMTESQFLVYLRLTHKPGDSVKLTIQRGGERREVSVPMW
jgi:serine protease Do